MKYSAFVIGMAMAFFFFGCFSASAAEKTEKDGDETRELSRGGIRLFRFQEKEMDFQLLRGICADVAGGGTVGEIFTAAENIKDGHPASWCYAFLSLAERVEKDGLDRQERGHSVSAGESLLRSAAYYRAAEYYGDPLSAEPRAWGMKCREVFLKAMDLSPWRAESVFIPAGKEGDFYPGYFITPGKKGEKRKTLMAQSGFDGTAEEMYFAVGKAALERGYNVLLFEGPGQAGKRRFHPDSAFVPDLGPVIRAIYNFLSSRPEVNPKQIALYGASLGGYFALSGALGEPRLGALILNSPLTDLQEYLTASMGAENVAMFGKNDLTTEEIAAMTEKDLPPKYRFSLLSLCLRFGKPSVKAWLDGLSFFRIPEEKFASLAIPVLGLVSEAEGEVPANQARKFTEAAPRAILRIFEKDSGANAHCQLDNMPLSWAVALDWLDEQFR